MRIKLPLSICQAMTLCCAILSAVPATAQTFDPAVDFSTSANPSGVWSYGWSPSLGGPFQLDAFFTTSDFNFSDIDMWQGRQSGDYQPCVAHNSTAASHTLGGTPSIVAPWASEAIMM